MSGVPPEWALAVVGGSVRLPVELSQQVGGARVDVEPHLHGATQGLAHLDLHRAAGLHRAKRRRRRKKHKGKGRESDIYFYMKNCLWLAYVCRDRQDSLNILLETNRETNRGLIQYSVN